MFRLSSLACSEALCIMKIMCVKQTGCPLKLAHWLVVISRIKINVELQLKPAQLLAYAHDQQRCGSHVHRETCGRPIFPEEHAPDPPWQHIIQLPPNLTETVDRTLATLFSKPGYNQLVNTCLQDWLKCHQEFIWVLWISNKLKSFHVLSNTTTQQLKCL